jgi:hypothetical protein
VFDRATIIVAERHLKPVRSLVPRWWGIVVGKPRGETQVCFQTLRPAATNKKVDPYAVAQLLWIVEAAAILDELGEPPNVLRQRRSILYQRLADLLNVSELRRRVTACLKSRKNWRLPAPPPPSDGLFPPSAK